MRRKVLNFKYYVFETLEYSCQTNGDDEIGCTVVLSGLPEAQIFSKMSFLGVSVKVFLDEVSI